MHSSDDFVFDWSFPAAFAWGLLVTLSLAGWGHTCLAVLLGNREDRNTEWGLAASLGLAVFLVTAGFMLMLSTFSAAFIAFFLLAGLVLLIVQMRLRRVNLLPGAPPGPGLKIIFLGLCLLIGLSYARAVAMRFYNEDDDFAAYFALMKMALDTGTFFDPFSYRLLGALGGQIVLNTLASAFLPWKYTYLVEMGIVGLILAGLALEMVRGHDARAWKMRLFIGVVALTFPIPRTNTASELTGVVLFIALLRLFELVLTRLCRGWRAALLIGGLIAALSTLRCPYLFACAFIGSGLLSWYLWENKRDRREIIREALMTAVVTTILLTPWWVVTYHSSGAFLYPLFKGTQQPGWTLISNSMSVPDTIAYIGNFLLSYSFLILFSPVCFLKVGRERQILIIAGGAIFIFSMALLAQMTFGLPSDLYRYLLPLAFAFGLYSLGVVARQFLAATPGDAAGLSGWRIKGAMILGAIVLGWQIYVFTIPLCQNAFRLRWVLDARNQFWTHGAGAVTDDEAGKDYRSAFAKIPAGSRILIALDYPYLLDYHKYSIYNIDQVGAASLAPGFPYFRGSEPVKTYLLSHHIAYIAHVHFDYSLFLHSRKAIEHNLAGSIPVYHFFATYELDFCNNIDRLAASNRILFDRPDIQVIDLKGDN